MTEINVPPQISTTPSPPPGRGRRWLSLILSLCLGSFLLDAAISVLDDTLIVFLNIDILTAVRVVAFTLLLPLAVLTYGLMGLTPLIPKRYFLPLTLFLPVTSFGFFLPMIYFYNRLPQIAWWFSIVEFVVGMVILHRVQGGFALRWPLVAEHHLAGRSFSWRNLTVFLLVNLLVVPPVVIGYAILCSELAVGHFSDGFLVLSPDGFQVQVRTYTRDDGKAIRLIPMTHVADAEFYHGLTQAFPTNSIILMEGVTDSDNLLTNRNPQTDQIQYERLAKSLGLAEQAQEFVPTQGQLVMADVDINQFTPTTIGLLNLGMLMHTKGVNAQTLGTLLLVSPSPEVQRQFLEDLLRLRNRQLLNELKTRLPEADYFIVPWGVAHMPEIAREIGKWGFRLQETQEQIAIRFWADKPKPHETDQRQRPTN